jgi:hypothetical protein
MNDVLLFLTGPVLVLVAVVAAKIIEHHTTECRHDYDDWEPCSTEHAYVQQKQCKKCKFIYTYQERKIGHEHQCVHKE